MPYTPLRNLLPAYEFDIVWPCPVFVIEPALNSASSTDDYRSAALPHGTFHLGVPGTEYASSDVNIIRFRIHMRLRSGLLSEERR